MSSGEEKSEKATPKKLKESRKEGQVARTQDLGAWASVLFVSLSLPWLAGAGMDRVRALLVDTVRHTATAGTQDMFAVLRSGAGLAMLMALVLGSCILVVGVASAVAQGGLFFATKAMKPKWSRLNLLQGAKRLFGPHAAWEGLKMLLKSMLVGFFVWRAVRGLLPLVGGLVPLTTGLEIAADAATGLMRDVALAGLVAAAADYGMQRRKTGKQVRMTKKEVRDEHKQAEGDPHVKGQIRSRRMAAARNRMMADVPQADVLLVNPTHVAVALRYDPAKGTPRVVAKGAGLVATKIRAIAEEHRVTLVEDVPLARALYGGCEVGQAIPPQLYQAVAQVLAFVLSMKAAGVPAGRHRT
ncbi:MAG: EscU/YscU/HrcU family type III secretion system export apparatus switch protein, partial [Nocardioidaceae bacterium]